MTALTVDNDLQDASPGASCGVTIDVYRDLDAARPLWQTFQENAVGSPHQAFEWVEPWLRTEGRNRPAELCVVVGRDAAGACRFLLPFVVHETHGCSVLEWAGGEQGNYECGFFARETGTAGTLPPFDRIWPEILAALPPVDAINLACQPTDLDGQRNPFLALPHQPAPDPGHAFPLDRNWESHYAAQFSAASRRELRRCERRLAEQGELGFHETTTASERLAVFIALREQKRERFGELGIPDFFADEGVETFYHALMAAPPPAAGCAVRIFSLRCGDEILAANIGVRFQDTFYGLLSSTTNAPLRRFAPGNILFRRIVDALSMEGVTQFDCGAGEDAHKMRWCTQHRERFHTIIPVTMRGRLYSRLVTLKVIAKRQIKQSPRLWSLAKEARRLKARLVPRALSPAV